MTNEEILQTAMEQSAWDIGCAALDFLSDKNVVVDYKLSKRARKYIKEPVSCSLVSYGNNLVAAVTQDVRDVVTEYIGKFEFYHCFETPNLHWLNRRLEKQGQKICFMAEYYLPDLSRLKERPCGYELRTLSQADFQPLYLPEWSNALCKERKSLDVLGVGAYHNGRLIGLAGCSADCEKMWQIGVDVLPRYRRRGVASALTSSLALEIIKRGKTPFYCSAWSNIRSVKNAIKSGFIPAWVELSAKPAAMVDEINGECDLYPRGKCKKTKD